MKTKMLNENWDYNMESKDIQKILEEQRHTSKIFKATNHEIAMTINNRNKGQEVHDKKSATIKKQYLDPTYKEWRHQITKDACSTVEFKQAHAEGITKREINGWAEKNDIGAKKRWKTIQTPYGIFESKKAVVAWMTGQGIPGALSRVSRGLVSGEYFYIGDAE